MLRSVQIGGALPFSYPVDPSSIFQGGMIAQLRLYGNNVVCGVSDGTAPLGIIDDCKTTAFYQPSIDEVTITPAVGESKGGKIVSVTDVMAVLQHSNIASNSFISDIEVYIKEQNGVVIYPAGTELNFDKDGDGIVDSIRSVSSYQYQVPGVPGDDTTMASKRVTIWFERGIFETDQYEVNQRFPLNAPLFVSENGYLTTKQVAPNYPSVGIVLGPPTSRNNTLQFLWL